VSGRPPLDRAAKWRTDPPLDALRTRRDSLVVPVWRNRVLVEERGERRLEPRLIGRDACAELCRRAEAEAFLGMLADRACFAVTVPGAEEAPADELFAGAEFRDLRFAGNLLEPRDAELLAYARGLLHFHRHHAFCPRCGGALRSIDGGHARRCDGCDQSHFPRLDPAIMALVMHQGRCLLARQPGWPPAMFSLLAGFVEQGESLEQTVVREVREEVGLDVVEVRYATSQPWPFPRSLMIGFSMRATSADFVVDGEEIEQARWCSREELEHPDGFFYPPPYSLAGQLIAAFASGEQG
jgi:NAD+ diphosphatase